MSGLGEGRPPTIGVDVSLWAWCWAIPDGEPANYRRFRRPALSACVTGSRHTVDGAPGPGLARGAFLAGTTVFRTFSRALRPVATLVLLLPMTGVMACGIRVAQESEGCTVHLDGRLTAAQVDDLLRACADAARPIRIDLTALRSLDVAAFQAIQRLVASGIQLVGVPWYLRQKMTRSE
jgi:STAS domain-containing protein